jgi:origin recognition complex subunit 1
LQVIRHLKSQNDCPEFEFVEVNGMTMTNPQQTYSEIYRQIIEEKRVSSQKAQKSLASHFENGNSDRKPVVLMVDEVGYEKNSVVLIRTKQR